MEQANHASRMNVPFNPTTGTPVPNEWGRQLQAWSEEHDAARLCLALLMWGGAGGMQQDQAFARALAERSLAWCRGAAEGGEAVAQWVLGECWSEGLGMDAAEQEQAVAWYRRAAEQGHAGAQRSFGWCNEHGEGVEQNVEQAAAWWRRAAEQGHAGAQHSLGWCYEHGRGVEQD
ncbi:MAG: tetratricopeptide repeat protein, partial [Stenotrophomonas sp.]